MTSRTSVLTINLFSEARGGIMGRSSLLALLVALLFAAPPAAGRPAAASSGSPAVADCQGDFSAKLRCWRERAGTGEREVTLGDPVRLDTPIGGVDWAGYRDAFRRGRLSVSVPGGHESGAGGTVLLILAGERHVAPDSKVTTLPDQTIQSLRAVCDDLCDIVGAAAGRGPTVAGKALLDAHVASGVAAPGRPWGTVSLLALVLLLALLGALVLRTRARRARPAAAGGAAGAVRPEPSPRQPEPPPRADATAARRRARHRPGRRVAVPPGPRRTAVVRSDLHPQGYVEVDRCLFRAVWADDQAPAPGMGAAVDVVQGAGSDSDILLALPPGDRH
jgi:hypothetical protein